MVAAIRTATGISETGEKANHFIYMLNWWMDKEFELDSDEPGVNLRLLLDQASQKRCDGSRHALESTTHHPE